MLNSLTNKRGSIITDIFIWMVSGFIIVILAAVFLYGFNLLTNSLTGIDSSGSNFNLNVSDAATKTFGQINIALNQLKWWTFMIIFALAASTFLSNFLVRIHPVLFVFHVIVSLIAIVVSIIIQNAYKTLYLSGGVLGTELQSFAGSSWIYLNLPIWVTVIAIIGGAIAFIPFRVDDDLGGGFG